MTKLTSIEAYRWLKDEGIIGKRQTMVLDIIMKYPELTDKEIASKLKSNDSNYVRPRRRELVLKGIIFNCGIKECSITKRKAMTWMIKKTIDTNRVLEKPGSELIKRKRVVDLCNKYLKYSQEECCKGIMKMFKEEVFKL